MDPHPMLDGAHPHSVEKQLQRRADLDDAQMLERAVAQQAIHSWELRVGPPMGYCIKINAGSRPDFVLRGGVRRWLDVEHP